MSLGRSVYFRASTRSLFVFTDGTVSLHPVLTGPDRAFLGTRVTFQCTAPASSPPVTYELVRDGDVVVDTEIAFDENQTVPFRQKVSASTEGSYHCKAMAGGSTAVSNSIKLSVVSKSRTQTGVGGVRHVPGD